MAISHRPALFPVIHEWADHLAAGIAHELGHACTRTADIERRRAPTDEWGSESAADWYAYRWGFGREIARDRRTRRPDDHGPGPGQVVSFDMPDGRECWRVSSRFVFSIVQRPTA